MRALSTGRVSCRKCAITRVDLRTRSRSLSSIFAIGADHRRTDDGQTHEFPGRCRSAAPGRTYEPGLSPAVRRLSCCQGGRAPPDTKPWAHDANRD